MKPSSSQERQSGRPREPETDQRILLAAQQLLAQQGFVRMSMDNVALKAGVTKPTVYRRYPNKIVLALEAVRAFCDLNPPHYVGSTRADLLEQMRQFQTAMSRPHGMALLGTMLAEEHHNPTLLEQFRQYLVLPRRLAIATILERARHNGEFPKDANLELAGDLLVGAFYAHYLSGAPFSGAWADGVVDAVLRSVKARL
jgi:AcrR family transcriptional regulator